MMEQGAFQLLQALGSAASVALTAVALFTLKVLYSLKLEFIELKTKFHERLGP